jgi:WD40 repeat protein
MTEKERKLNGPDRGWTVFGLSSEGYGFSNAARQTFFGNEGTLCVLMQFYHPRGCGNGIPYLLQHPARVRLAAGVPLFIASVDAKHTVRGWKFKEKEVSGTVETPTWAVDLKQIKPNGISISPDGTMVAVTGELGTVEVLSTRAGRAVATLKGHDGAVRSAAFAPDSGLIATGGADGTVRLWNPWSGEEEVQLKGHTGSVNAVWFASDDVLITAGADKTARVWVYKP